MNELELTILDTASSALVSCQGCTKCCEKGLVYILPEEKERLQSLGVPLIEIDGVPFIKRKPDGSCSMLDKQHSRCSIYEDRPMCCRIFPLDVFSRNGKLEWAMYTYCPKDRMIPMKRDDKGKAHVDREVVAMLADQLEGQIPQPVLRFLATEDAVAAQVEILDDFKDEYTILSPLRATIESLDDEALRLVWGR